LMFGGLGQIQHSWFFCILGILLCAVVLAATVAGSDQISASSSLQEEIRELQDRLSDIESDMQDYESTLEELQSQRSRVSSELDEVQEELQRAEYELREAETRLQLSEKELEQVEIQLAQAEEELQHRTDLLNRRVRAMYELGMVSYLEVLLSAADFSDFVRRFDTLRQIVSQDVAILEAVQEQREVVAQHRQECEEKKEQAQRWAAEVQSRKNHYEAEVARYENRLNELSDQEQEYRAALDELERRSEQVAHDITEKQRELQLGEGVPVFNWPMAPGTYWVSSPFGPRYHPILGEWRTHTGVDMAASSGTSIRAAADGVVMSAGWMGGYGQTVILGHTGNFSTLYAHASQLLVSSGDNVSRGDLIARVGSTGFSTGPHLHFEVRLQGQPKDPQEFLPPR